MRLCLVILPARDRKSRKVTMSARDVPLCEHLFEYLSSFVWSLQPHKGLASRHIERSGIGIIQGEIGWNLVQNRLIGPAQKAGANEQELQVRTLGACGLRLHKLRLRARAIAAIEIDLRKHHPR